MPLNGRCTGRYTAPAGFTYLLADFLFSISVLLTAVTEVIFDFKVFSTCYNCFVNAITLVVNDEVLFWALPLRSQDFNRSCVVFLDAIEFLGYCAIFICFSSRDRLWSGEVACEDAIVFLKLGSAMEGFAFAILYAVRTC